MTVEDKFIYLLQIAIGHKYTLPNALTNEEWKEVYAIAARQTVIGVCLAAIEKLPKSQRPPDHIFWEWIGQATQIQFRNEYLNKSCHEIQKKLNDNGFKTCILKGQGIATYYGSIADFRQAGDIDIWVAGGMKDALTYARKLCGEIEYDYVNAHLPLIKGSEVELHWRIQALTNPLRNHFFQKWVKANESELLSETVTLGKDGNIIINVPSIKFNSIYILLHLYHHLMESGIGFRQVMDYYFVLLNNKGQDKEEWQRIVDKLGMKRFSEGVMWVMQYVFLLDDSCLMCMPSENEGKFLLREIISGGNFGKYDPRIKDVGLKGALYEKSRQVQHVINIGSRYPMEMIWTPYWLVFHWIWKKLYGLKIVFYGR